MVMDNMMAPPITLINKIMQGFMDWRANLGAELVTLGDFTGSATGWTLGSGWTYNANAVDRDGAGTATMTQATVVPEAGAIYKVVFTISAYTDGSVTVSIGGTSGTARSSAATFTEYIKAADATVLTFTPTANATFTIDDVSVKKVGYVAADGVAVWIDDRGATAGKGALHIMTEDGTVHVFGDRVGIRTVNPAVAGLDVNGTSQIQGDLLINLGGFAGTLTHAITAGRTWTGPDRTGTLALQDYDSLRLFRRVCHIAYPKSWPASTEVVSGSGTTAVTEDSVTLSLGTTHASTAGRRIEMRLPGTAEQFSIQWGKKFHLAFTLQLVQATVSTTETFRIYVTQSTTIANLAAHGLGVKVTGQADVQLATYGTGGSETLVDSTIDLVHKDRIHVLIEHDPASADRLYINGTLRATQSTAANIPSTEPGADYNLFISAARSGGADTGNDQLLVENIEYGQEL